MTSILTNAGAMVALSTLAQTNKNLLETQTQISTGKKVDSAAQNAAVWAVTTVMEADVDGFDAITESLSLGKATVTVARNASEKVTDLLREMKEKIVTAQGENVDRAKIQTDIDELRNQIGSIVSAAQFNGLNLIDGSKPEGIEVLSSLDRSTTGVASASIKVTSQNLSTGSAVAGTGAAITAGVEVEDSETNAAATGSASVTIAMTETGTGFLDAEAEFELKIDGVSVGSTVSVASGTSDDDARAAVVNYINNLGRDDIKASIDPTGIKIDSTNKFDDVVVRLDVLRDGGLDTLTNADADNTLIPGVSSIKTENADENATAATIQIAGTVDATDTLIVKIGGETLGTFSGMDAGGDANLSASALADWINANLTSDLTGKINATATTDTVTLASTASENLEIELEVAAAGAGTTEVALATANAAGTGVGAATTLTLDDVGTSVSGTMEAKAASLELGSATVVEGDSYTVYLREGLDGPVGEFTYVAANGDDQNDVAEGLAALIAADSNYDVKVSAITDTNTSANARLQIDSTGSKDVYVALEASKGGSGSGGLGKLNSLDVGTKASAAQALDDIEDLIQTSIDAAAAFGSTEKRLDIQADFVDSLVDSMKAGIGALVDTDMEEASARLQALQVQQQLGTQALSIANSGPQNILSLFR